MEGTIGRAVFATHPTDSLPVNGDGDGAANVRAGGHDDTNGGGSGAEW
jgi:hypothetical protein